MHILIFCVFFSARNDCDFFTYKRDDNSCNLFSSETDYLLLSRATDNNYISGLQGCSGDLTLGCEVDVLTCNDGNQCTNTATPPVVTDVAGCDSACRYAKSVYVFFKIIIAH